MIRSCQDTEGAWAAGPPGSTVVLAEIPGQKRLVELRGHWCGWSWVRRGGVVWDEAGKMGRGQITKAGRMLKRAGFYSQYKGSHWMGFSRGRNNRIYIFKRWLCVSSLNPHTLSLKVSLIIHISLKRKNRPEVTSTWVWSWPLLTISLYRACCQIYTYIYMYIYISL